MEAQVATISPGLTQHAAAPAETLTVAGQEITVFAEWPPLLEAMLADIAGARRRVWMEVYIFADDAGARRVAAAMMERARAGVDVRLFYDAVGSAGTPASAFAAMQGAGVKVHAFHTLLEGLMKLRPLTILNRRNHRKLLVVDEAVGYFGGMNIVDNVEALHAKMGSVGASAGWRDVHLRLRGTRACELAESFERSWARAHGLTAMRRSRALWREWRKPYHRLSSEMRQEGAAEGRWHAETEAIHFFDSGPQGKMSRAARLYALMIRRARRQITISMAYFIPVGAVLRALLWARKHRVGVMVIVPGDSDVPIVKRASAYLYDRLIRRGFRIYERRQRMLHAKVMVIDGRYTLVGSCNLDPRSLYTNREFVAVIRSAALARVIQRICVFERAQSQRITMQACRRVGWWGRVANRLAWMLRWWL